MVASCLGGTGCGLGRNETRVFWVGVIQSEGIMFRWAETSTTVVTSILI